MPKLSSELPAHRFLPRSDYVFGAFCYNKINVNNNNTGAHPTSFFPRLNGRNPPNPPPRQAAETAQTLNSYWRLSTPNVQQNDVNLTKSSDGNEMF